MSDRLDKLNERIDALTGRVEKVEAFQAEHGEDAAELDAAEAKVADLETRVGVIEAAEGVDGSPFVASDVPAGSPANPGDLPAELQPPAEVINTVVESSDPDTPAQSFVS